MANWRKKSILISLGSQLEFGENMTLPGISWKKNPFKLKILTDEILFKYIESKNLKIQTDFTNNKELFGELHSHPVIKLRNQKPKPGGKTFIND